MRSFFFLYDSNPNVYLNNDLKYIVQYILNFVHYYMIKFLLSMNSDVHEKIKNNWA